MGHGLGSDIGSDLSSAPPSPRLVPSSPPPAPRQPPSLPPPSPPPVRERSLSSVTEPPWKTRPRPKRQHSTSVPNPPSSPKRRKRGEKEIKEKDEKGKDEKGKDTVGKGKAVSGRGKGPKAVGKIQVKAKEKDPSPQTSDEKASTSKVAPAPWKTTKTKVVPPTPEPTTSKARPPPFAKSTPKPKPAPSTGITSKPPFNTARSASPDASSAIKPTPSSAIKPAPSNTKSTRTTKRPAYNESNDSTDEEEEEEKPKRHKRRKSGVEATPKAARKPRPTLPATTPKGKSKPEAVELRPASFLTKTSSFLTKPVIPSTSANLQPREDVWSCDDLTGLTWVKLDIHKCEIVPGNEQAVELGEQWCWWPAEVKQNTSNGLKLALCGLGIERELGPHAADETNVLTFRKPNISTVRFPTFKTAFSPPSKDIESPEPANPSPGEPLAPPVGESSTQTTGEHGEPTLPTTKSTTPILPTSPVDLEAAWKQALACAFKIDTESNDGLEDIYLLFSQKSKSPREDDESSGHTVLEEQEEELDEDILENGTSVLCRYRTRYYPAQIVSYHPREGKAKRRPGPKGKYKCVFADDSTKLAVRREIMTTLDDGFATCSLGTYHRYTSHSDEKPSGVREPSPAPRAHSPAPEAQGCQIDPEEYCSRERMRDQLRPVLPFLVGLIERRYIPGKGIVEAESSSEPKIEDNPPTEQLDTSSLDNLPTNEEPGQPEPVLDRHAIFMQGGRARKNLAYSVYTGDLNEDDCEELMFEISRWALRGERWACEGGNQEGEVMEQECKEDGEATNQDSEECVEGAIQEDPEGEGTSQGTQEGESTSREVQESGESRKVLEVAISGEGSSSQQPRENEGAAEEPGGTTVPASAEDVEMQDVTQDTIKAVVTVARQDSPPEAKSGDTTELEDEPLKVVKILEQAPSTHGNFRTLVKLQPPRPVGAPDYEGLTPEERMGYVSDVLYPEAAALILSYRRGIRTQPGPLADPAAEHALYTAGLQAARNTCSTSDWVEQILAVRQLRESNSKYHVEEQAQVVVAGGTKSRPRYMTSVLK